MTNNNNKEELLKIIILGSSQVGKTSILNRYFNNEFKENMLSSIGIDFKTKFFKFEENKVKFNYIDTAGQEKFRAISVNYLKGTNGVILVFDLTNKETFDLIGNWIEDIEQNNQSDIAKILFGNKSDVLDGRQVSIEEAEQLADKLGCKYYEGSAKTGQNINEALDEIAIISYEQYKSSERRHSIRISSEVSNDNNKKDKKAKKKKALLSKIKLDVK